MESFLRNSPDCILPRSHGFTLSLPKNVQLPKISLCPHDSANCYALNNMVNFIRHLHDSTETQLSETIKAIHTLVPQTNMFTVKRKERAFLPFIDSLAKGLFGTATMDDVNLLARHINALNRKTQLISRALYQHGDHLSSFMSLMDNKTLNLMKGIQNNAKQIQAVSDTFSSNMVTFQQSMLNISQILISITNQGNILRSNLNQLQSAVQSLVEGRISPYLLPKHALTQALHKVQTILTNSYSGFYLTQFHPSYYYTTSNFMFTRNHSDLYITLRFPVSSQSQPLTLYKII